jgi:acylglycerol lipase
MKELELLWTSSDNLRFYVKVWEPAETPKGVVCLVHGIGEHINRYNRWAAAFVDEGYAVIGFDQRGHGRSKGKRGHTPSYDILLQDIELLLKKSRERYPDIPDILFGQSLGGNLVLNYILRKEIKPTCAVASSPWLRLAYDIPKIQEKLGRFLKNIVPGLVQKSNLNVNDLSRDQEVVKRYVEDPLVHNKVSLNLCFSSIDAGLWVLENAGKLDLPVLLMHGDSDKITSHQATIEFSQKAKSFTWLKIWEGLTHELHNEPEKQAVFNFVLNWIRIYTEKDTLFDDSDSF